MVALGRLACEVEAWLPAVGAGRSPSAQVVLRSLFILFFFGLFVLNRFLSFIEILHEQEIGNTITSKNKLSRL